MEGYGLFEVFLVIYVNFIWGKNKLGSIGCFWLSIDVVIYLEEMGEYVVLYEYGEIIVKGL